MWYRVQKCAVAFAHSSIVVLAGVTAYGALPWPAATGLLLVSGFWLVLTTVQLPLLLRSFEDRLARMQVLVPGILGVIAAFTAALLSDAAWTPLLAACSEILLWGVVFDLYDIRSRDYVMLGHGPVPDDTWVCPDLQSLQEGDLILTDGRMAARSGNSVGHVELVIKDEDGKLTAFSSYMESGAVLHSLRSLITLETRRREHYIVLRLKVPFTPEQSAKAIVLAREEMLARNQKWCDKATQCRQALVERIPVSEPWRKRIFKRFKPTGYYFLGQVKGSILDDRWTCMGAILKLLHDLGIKTRPYGTGMFGWGTGWGNPLMPIRLVRDSNYRLLRTADQKPSSRQAAAGGSSGTAPAG